MKQTLKYSVAAQILHAKNIKLYAGDQQILQYKGSPRYDITPIKEYLKIERGKEALKDPVIKRILDIEVLRKLGFDLERKIADSTEKTLKRQKVRYILERKHLVRKPLKSMPTGHEVHVDIANKRIRLAGPNAGPMKVSRWISLEREESDVPTQILNPTHFIDSPEDIVSDTMRKLLKLPEEPKIVNIPEIPVLITDANEIVCIPQTLDEPSLAAVGQKRSGKTYLIHGIADRVYWKRGWNKLIAFLNDKLMDTEYYSLPNPEDVMIQNYFHGEARPLPMVHLSPVIDTVGEQIKIIHPEEIGFKISLPWKELISNFDKYYRLDKSEAYFVQLKPLLNKCETPEEAVEIVKESDLHVNIQSKIVAAMTKFFNSKILDITNKVPSSWTVKLPNYKATYNPITAALLAGLVPSLYTEQLQPKDFYPQYFRYLVEDLFRRQSTDPYFTGRDLQIWLFVDEVLDVASTERKTVSMEILRALVTQGGPKRIGSFLATQNFLKIEERVRTNIKYLFTFVNPGEAASIANQYNLDREWAAEIKTLKKFECVAITTEEFVVYDSYGRRWRSKGPFKGRALPPLSMHRAPRDMIEIGGELGEG